VAEALSIALFKTFAQPYPNYQLSILQDQPHMYWYVMGPSTANSLGNYWTQGNSFPTPTQKYLYLHKKGILSPSPPTEVKESTSFNYNPNDPVPTLGGNNLLLPKCGPWDQSPLEKRDDIISFQTDRLTSNLPITGKILMNLAVSSNATDTDFTVKLIDVYPDGTTMLVQDGILRMKWRDSEAQSKLMVPGLVYNVTVVVWSTSYIFNIGHSIRVDISSSNYPRFSANPNNGNFLSQDGPKLVAYNKVFHNKDYPSSLILPVVSMEDLKEIDLKLVEQNLMEYIQNL